MNTNDTAGQQAIHDNNAVLMAQRAAEMTAVVVELRQKIEALQEELSRAEQDAAWARVKAATAARIAREALRAQAGKEE